MNTVAYSTKHTLSNTLANPRPRPALNPLDAPAREPQNPANSRGTAVNIQENYNPKRMAASGVLYNGAGNLAGFFATAAGTVTISDVNVGAAGTTLVDTFTVAAGIWYPLPFAMGNGCYITLAGGAIITVGYTA